MAILAEDIEAVRSATDLVALVGERVALRRVGRRWVGLCPFHAENTPSFSVNGELGVYYCFGCQARGDAITFLRETEHLDFASAVELLASRAGIALRYESPTERDGAGGRSGSKRKAELTQALEKALSWYHERLVSSHDAAPARRYLRSRGYDGDTVRHYKLGWAPEGGASLQRELSVDEGLLEEVGLLQRDQGGRLVDFFRGRVLFPIFDAAGRPVGAGGRILPGGEGPKYKNTQATALYDKSKVLYGLNWAKGAIVERGQVVVCEGYTDVIGLQRAGIGEAVATCGTALTEGHVKLLAGFARRVVLAYDADAAGLGAAERFYEWEKRFKADISVVELPAGSDPAELAQADPGRLRDAVEHATPFLGFRLQRLFSRSDLATPEGRAHAAEAALGLVAEHPDPLVRDQYLMQVSDRTKLAPESLRALRAARPSTKASPELKRAQLPVPPPELEALRAAVHHPEKVAGRLEASFFSSDLARASFLALASALTLHGAIGSAPPEVADLLTRVAALDTGVDPDDVLRRLLDRAAVRALSELEHTARSAAHLDEAAGARLAERAKALQLALQEMRAIEPGPEEEGRLQAAEARLLGLLRG